MTATLTAIQHELQGLKQFHVVEGSNHMQLYDVPKDVDEAVSVLVAFFKSKL